MTRPQGTARLGARLRSAWIGLTKRTLNPLVLRRARAGRGPFTIVRHVGRKSGRRFETPIIVQPAPRGFVVELTYGPTVDWYRNVRAAGGCVLVYRGEPRSIDAFEQLPPEVGLASFPPSQRWVLRLLRRRDYVLFVEAA
jgi:deazaflavin-dependent oxidoreductase (nitroreductase family)